jgi:glycosyltransferase involved in cell wall biosynthesis
MKTSFIATVLNEEASIDTFVQSILHQSKKVDEIIIVDGGSKDETLEKLKTHRKVTVLSKKGNRSKGRNFGIEHTKGDIILVSDAGCILEKDWVKEITAPFRNDSIDVVSGYYKPVTNSTFEKSLATYTCVMPDKVDPKNFLPSSRSVAFRKAAWVKVGGYPEYLDTCEDLVFAKNLKKAGMAFIFVKSAIVFWPQRKNIKDAFKQFYAYALGDGMARYFRPNTSFLFIRYFIALCIVYLAIRSENIWWWLVVGYFALAYAVWAIRKNYRYVKSREAYYYLPLLQMTSDIAVLFGTTIGCIKSFTNRP